MGLDIAGNIHSGGQGFFWAGQSPRGGPAAEPGRMDRGDMEEGCLYGRNGKLQREASSQCARRATRRPIWLVTQVKPDQGRFFSLKTVVVVIWSVSTMR